MIHRWQNTHTCIFTPLLKIRFYLLPLYSIYSGIDRISIYEEIYHFDEYFTWNCMLGHGFLQKKKKKNPRTRQLDSSSHLHCWLLPLLALVLDSKQEARPTEHSKPYLPFSINYSESVFMQWCAIKANTQDQEFPNIHVFISISHDNEARQIWAL